MEHVTLEKPVNEPAVQAWGDTVYSPVGGGVGEGGVPGQTDQTQQVPPMWTSKPDSAPTRVEGGLSVLNIDGPSDEKLAEEAEEGHGKLPEHLDSFVDSEDLLRHNTSRSQRLSYFNKVTADTRGGQTLLGTFMGVYVPTTQNILGIILFIRLPWITGQAGILQAALIVSLSCASSFLTSLSMSAIATNGKVTSGGCYQIIKKSLSPEFGCVVGLLLFLSNTFGVAMYILGFTEAVNAAGGSLHEDEDPRIMGALTLFSVFLIVYVGISYVSKAALLILSGVVLAIMTIHAGVFYHTAHPDKDAGLVGLTYDNFSKNWGSDYRDDLSFGALLAIFFPAVTDPLAGSNLSGDLKDAQRSIPPGTLAAVATTTCIFLLQVFYTGGCVERETLIDDYLIVTKLGWPWDKIVFAGIMLSTLGAALQSLAGAPRLIAALAKDNYIPWLRPLAPAPGQEPRTAVILCATLSMCVLMIGELNVVAPFITMWFLTCYAIINGACFILAFEQSPTFRPRWKYFHWSVSLLAALIILGMMFFVSWYFAMVALIFAFCIYKYVQRQTYEMHHRQEGAGGGGGWKSGMRYNQVRNGLLMLQEADVEFKYWRPFILFICKLSKDGTYIPQGGMINLISQLMKRGKGLAFVGGVMEGDYLECAEQARSANKHLKDLLQEREIDGFPEVIVSHSIREGQLFLLQGKGFGPLRPNTVMLGFPDVGGMDDAEAVGFVKLCKEVATAHKTLMLCKTNEGFPLKTERLSGHLDVWWVFDLLPARGLLLLTPYLLQQHAVWKATKLRLFVVTGHEDDSDNLKEMLANMLRSAGLESEVHIIQMSEEEAPRYTHSLKLQQGGPRRISLSAPASDSAPAALGDPTVACGPSNPLAQITKYLQSHSVHTAALTVDVSVDASIEHGESSSSSPATGSEQPSSTPSASAAAPAALADESPAPARTAPEAPTDQGGDSSSSSSSKAERKKADNAAAKKRRSSAVLKKDKFGSKLTAAITKNSGDSALVMLTMPVPQLGQPASEYLHSVDTLIKGLSRVILIQESGFERVELYSA